MATLTGNQIKDTYYKLVQVDNGQLVQNGIGSPLTGSINLSGSLHVTGSQTVGGDLTVTGDVTARSIITALTQSTVLYKSGSTQFGDDATDTHSFSGSVTISNTLALGNYSNISASLDAAEDAIVANSASAAVALTSLSSSVDTHLDANISALSASTDSHLDSEIALLSASVDTHLDANISALSASTDTHLDANITSLSGSSHTRREEISSSFATTIAGLDASGFATDAELASVSGAFATTQATQDSTINTLASTGSNTFNGLQNIVGDLHLTGSFDKRSGNIISIQNTSDFGQTEIVQLNSRVQFRTEPTSSGLLRGHLGIVYDGVNEKNIVNAYGSEIQLGSFVSNGKFTENIKLGTTASLFTISGSTEMTGSLVISGAIDSNEKANKIRFHYDTTGDLPSAIDYHGMFAHVHAEGKAYFAHGGVWVELVNSGSSVGVNNITDFSNQVSASAAASGFGSGGASIPAGTISGSAQIASLGYVSSSTTTALEVMTSASYAAITPVSGTLYIIQG